MGAAICGGCRRDVTHEASYVIRRVRYVETVSCERCSSVPVLASGLVAQARTFLASTHGLAFVVLALGAIAIGTLLGLAS